MDDVRNEKVYLFEMIPEFDDWCRSEHPTVIHYEMTMLEGVYIAFNEQQI